MTSAHRICEAAAFEDITPYPEAETPEALHCDRRFMRCKPAKSNASFGEPRPIQQRQATSKSAAPPAASAPLRKPSRVGRLTQHLRRQNWTAVAIEFVVVVFGVFLGFQLTAWNTDLANQRREAGILREIATDLRQDRAELTTGREVSLRRAPAAHYVIEKATGRSIAHLDANTASSASLNMRAGMPLPGLPAIDAAARRGLWAAIVSSYFAIPSTTAFDSLVSAGETGLIRDASLVRDIQNYRLSVNGITVTQLYSLRPMLGQTRAVGESFGLAALGDIEEAVLLKLVADTPQLAATIESQLGWIVIYITQIDAVAQRAAALLTRIASAIAD